MSSEENKKTRGPLVYIPPARLDVYRCGRPGPRLFQVWLRVSLLLASSWGGWHSFLQAFQDKVPALKWFLIFFKREMMIKTSPKLIPSPLHWPIAGPWGQRICVSLVLSSAQLTVKCLSSQQYAWRVGSFETSSELYGASGDTCRNPEK